MNFRTFFIALVASFTVSFSFAQAETKVIEASKTWVKQVDGVKPATKAWVLQDRTKWFKQNDITGFNTEQSPSVYVFEDTTEKRSGYGVWWCSNSKNANSWPTRAMFLSGLNGEGDYLLYFSNPNETRNGNTQRFSPSMFKKNGEVLEKSRTENSPMSLKFEPKFKEAEMTSIAFSYSSPNHNDFKYLTRENCEKY